MALLSDVPKVLRAYGLWGFSKRVWEEVNKDNLFTWASALAYSWLFAIFPFFIFLLALIPHLPARITTGALVQIRGFVKELPPPSGDMLWNNIQEPVQEILQKRTGPLLALGLVIALWSA